MCWAHQPCKYRNLMVIVKRFIFEAWGMDKTGEFFCKHSILKCSHSGFLLKETWNFVNCHWTKNMPNIFNRSFPYQKITIVMKKHFLNVFGLRYKTFLGNKLLYSAQHKDTIIPPKAQGYFLRSYKSKLHAIDGGRTDKRRMCAGIWDRPIIVITLYWIPGAAICYSAVKITRLF